MFLTALPGRPGSGASEILRTGFGAGETFGTGLGASEADVLVIGLATVGPALWLTLCPALCAPAASARLWLLPARNSATTVSSDITGRAYARQP